MTEADYTEPKCHGCGLRVYFASPAQADTAIAKHVMECPGVRLQLERRKVLALERIAELLHNFAADGNVLDVRICGGGLDVELSK